MFRKLTPEQRKWRRLNFQEAESDLTNLEADGYHVKRFSNVHWRITKDDYRKAVDLWPTTKKLMDLETRRVHQYRDLMVTLRKLFIENSI